MDIINECHRKARKDHVCDLCCETISKGDRYFYQFIRDGAENWSFKAHDRCEFLMHELWAYMDPYDLMDCDCFQEGIHCFCQEFICSNCEHFDNAYWNNCKEDNRYCIDKVVDMLTTYEVKCDRNLNNPIFCRWYLKKRETMKNKLTIDCINWIKDYFKDIPDGKAIIGISGGKDSTIAAALCVEALGSDRVIGVMMPQGIQKDINDSYAVIEHLKIKAHKVDIGSAFDKLTGEIINGPITESAGKNSGNRFMSVQEARDVLNNSVINTNLPARLRMATLYSIAALYPNARVVNTSNWSERYIGYSTKYGDSAGDFSPLGNLTVREVLMIGDDLDLPEYLVHKAPADGMTGKTDEEKIGFTYDQLDDYIMYVNDGLPESIVNKIEKMHKANEHKLLEMPRFEPKRGN